MSRSLPRILIKLVAKSFYREHTGLFFALFILVISNFFYTNVLNQTHLTPDQIIATALRMVLGAVRHPLGTGLLFAVFLLYSLKTWQYATRRLQAPELQFLFYSLNALRPARQLRAWAAVQLVNSLPIVALGAYAVVVGVAFGYWLVPLLIPAYLLGLILLGAGHYVRLTNWLSAEPTAATLPTGLRRWPKPLFSLFLYEVIVRKRVPLGITKLVSFASLILLARVFPDAHADPRFLGLLGLCVALAHAVLVQQSHAFEEFYLQFARNFPYSAGRVLGQQARLYGLLLLPELIWLLVALPFGPGLVGVGAALGTTLLFRAVLYHTGPALRPYLRLVFGLFILLLFATLFGLTLPLIAGTTLAAWALLHRRQYLD